MGEFSDRLSKMNESWGANKDETGGFNDSFEDGVHTFQVQTFGMKESNSTGEMLAVMEAFCLEGVNGGETWTAFFNLEKKSEKDDVIWGQRFLAQTVQKLGYENPQDFGEMENIIAEIAADTPKFTARVRTNKDGFKNLTILRVIEQQAEPEFTPEESQPEPEPEQEKPARKPTPQKKGWKKGDRVLVDFDGTDYAGTVEKVRPRGGKVTVVFDDEEIHDIEPKDLKPEGGVEEPAEETPTLAELVKFAEAWDVKADYKDRAAVIAAIKEYEWTKKDMTKEEVALVTAIDGKFE